MKYVKMLGLLAVAAAALMAFAGTASATTVTSSEGETPTIKATSTGTTLESAGTITCDTSTVEGTVSSHGAGVTASGSISKLTFGECTGNDAIVLENGGGTKGTGTLEIHPDPEAGSATGNGTLTSSGTRVTVRFTGIGINCVFETKNTDIGTFNTKTQTLEIKSAPIPRTNEDSGIFCGPSTGTWNGSYNVTSPKELAIH